MKRNRYNLIFIDGFYLNSTSYENYKDERNRFHKCKFLSFKDNYPLKNYFYECGMNFLNHKLKSELDI
jgi:hypothetical protein